MAIATGFLPASVVAQIDSGGGKAAIGAMTSHSSFGSAFATGVHQTGDMINDSGIIQVLYAAADTNTNQIPDEWENEFFNGRSFDPEADSDGDGTINRLEYIAGTNPQSSASAFRPEGALHGTEYVMDLPTVTGRTYKVFVSKNLSDWHLRETIIGDGRNKTFRFDEMLITSGPLHSEVHPSSYFFRVEVSLP